MSDKVRVAVAGAGYFAQFQYEAWTRIPEVELVGCANRTSSKAEAVAKQYAIPAAFETVEAMLDATKPDLLDIITPPETHLAAIRAAASRGVDCICQKPYCTSFEEAIQATEIADEAGITVVVHENFRFQPWHRKTREIVDSGRLGDIHQITFRLRPGDGQGPDAYLARQPYFQKMPRFLVHETAIHLIDTFRFLLGEVTGVYADLRKLNPVIAGEDAGVILFDFQSGARAVFDGNRLVDHRARNPRRTMGEMLVEGTRAVLRLNGDGELFIREHGVFDESPLEFDWQDRGFGGDCVFKLQQSVIQSRLGRTAFENSARDYLANIVIEDAIYASDNRGSYVAIK